MHNPILTHPVFEQLRHRAATCNIHSDSCIQILTDSHENFPAWVAAIQAAEKYILIEMYIFATDEFGRQMRDLLLEKQQAGVQVVIVYDWLGSIGAWATRFFNTLCDAGAQIVPYNPFGFARGLGLASRNHRKSFVIDGKIAFVSGLCISSAWNGQPEKQVAAWRDTGVQLSGCIVQDVIHALQDTLQSQRQTLPDWILHESRQPENHCDTVSGCRAALVATTARNNNMMRLDLNALAFANHHLWLTDAYFMPTRLYTQALINAANAGVDVRILIPKTSDIRWIARVSRTRYRELLQAGVRIFEWNGTMIHAKSAIVDGAWARVGSTNLNFSSWHLNRELDVVLEDENVVAQLETQFLADLHQATEIVLNETDRQVAREQMSRRLKRLKTINKQQAKAAAVRLLQLSRAFDGNLYDTEAVDEREEQAYFGLGLTLLFAAIVLWFFPKLLVLPVIFLLAMGGISTLVYAWKCRRKK